MALKRLAGQWLRENVPGLFLRGDLEDKDSARRVFIEADILPEVVPFDMVPPRARSKTLGVGKVICSHVVFEDLTHDSGGERRREGNDRGNLKENFANRDEGSEGCTEGLVFSAGSIRSNGSLEL